MTNTSAIKKLNDNPTYKTQVIAVLKNLNGESYSDALEILELAKYFLTTNAMLDYELARDIINSIDAAGD